MVSKHYNSHQFRVDLWNFLKEYCQQTNANRALHTLKDVIESLQSVENYFLYPGIALTEEICVAVKNEDFKGASNRISQIVDFLVNENYRNNSENIGSIEKQGNEEFLKNKNNAFEVLYVEDLSLRNEKIIIKKTKELVEIQDNLTYDLVVQRSFQDALICLLFNFNIQAVVIKSAPLPFFKNNTNPIKSFIQNILKIDLKGVSDAELGPLLGKYIHQFRPELDIYYVTDAALTSTQEATFHFFRRIFYRMENLRELHLAIINGISERIETPFFTALKEYSKRPVTVFHALPISRGNSVYKSRWISDFGDFYGRNVFLTETSATHGGLDSLLQPTGPLKKAQEKAAKAYGAEQTFFVTNGTSTSNKIVQQALIKPGDVVLVDRSCHKSHHYGLVLAGAFPAYLDAYPVEKYSMYGAVPLKVIKNKLLELREAGRLDKVKMLLLTNCTFDGIVYNVEKVMETVLAIKPDMVFLWDEAWFAFASFTYTLKQRTGMYVAQKLFLKYKTPEYRAEYEAHLKTLLPGESPTIPDPDKVKIRVYATQSTHKTLSSFRQGSMIHIWDEEFSRKVSDAFHESYMTHTTTSANYQILASLDVGRKQVELEGYELVERSIDLAMVLRAKMNEHPILNNYFRVLTANDLIPKEFRESGKNKYYSDQIGWDRMENAWEKDEFVLDPTKITLSVGNAGISGDDFKKSYLMERFNIQVNKTSRNSVLLMTNIGTTRGSITYLVNALLQIANELEVKKRSVNKREKEISLKQIHSLITDVPPLPDFSYFHHSFLAAPGVPGGNLREAFFLGYEEELCEYILLKDCLPEMKKNKELVSTSFVIPYPPGFPILVPGQVISQEIIKFMLALDVKEIHGYRADLGLKIFTVEALNRKNTISAMGAMQAMRALSLGGISNSNNN